MVRVDAAVGRAVAAEAPVPHDRAAAQPLRGQDLAEDRGIGRVERPQVQREVGVEALRRDLDLVGQELLHLGEGAREVRLEGRPAVLAQHLLGEVDRQELPLAEADQRERGPPAR